ncbi:MAG: hypothetical protein JWN25_2008 [Verrucomicrobiales bacterium]|nr:hypothetical protein [Verrucomicrobiales bacterium]MDB6130683.1 hypothetical protein [Verrucomicrobiales bacterium]
MYNYDVDRVRANTQPHINEAIDQKIEEQIRYYASQSKGAITLRIVDLDREWDIERWLGTNASGLALTGLALGFLGNKKWFLLTAGVMGFFMQHSIQGWCPPVPIMRQMGIRTRSEIDREKYALKALRGDFDNVANKRSDTEVARAHDVLMAVTM